MKPFTVDFLISSCYGSIVVNARTEEDAQDMVENMKLEDLLEYMSEDTEVEVTDVREE